MAINSLLALALSLATAVHPTQDDPKRNSLVGIYGVNVLIEALGENALGVGTSREQLKTDIEQKLRLAGIVVGSQFSPFVYVRINYALPTSASGQDMGYIAVVKVGLEQAVYVIDNYHRMYAPTWESSIIIWGPKINYEDRARKTVHDLIDKFINDYLAANPKK